MSTRRPSRVTHVTSHDIDVLDYTTGGTTWQGDPAATDGTVVGSNVLFTRGHRVFRAAFQ